MATYSISDLKSCYDIIFHSIAMLAGIRQKFLEPPMVCMISTSQNMVHTRSKAYGESLEIYGGCIWDVILEEYIRNEKYPPP